METVQLNLELCLTLLHTCLFPKVCYPRGRCQYIILREIRLQNEITFSFKNIKVFIQEIQRNFLILWFFFLLWTLKFICQCTNNLRNNVVTEIMIVHIAFEENSICLAILKLLKQKKRYIEKGIKAKWLNLQNKEQSC